MDKVQQDQISTLLNYFLTLNEYNFTQKVVMPLFQRLGYERVNYNNGPIEKGKDVICQKEAPFNRTELAAIQIKAVKINTSSASDAGFQQILTQIDEAFDEPVILHDGTRRNVDRVYLAVSHQINFKTLESNSTRFEKLIKRGLVPLDAHDIAKQIVEQHSDLCRQLIGSELDPTLYLTELPTNLPLLNALKSGPAPNLNQIYSELDFSMGGMSGRRLTSMHLTTSTDTQVVLSEEEWTTTRTTLEVLFKNLDIHTTEPSIEEIIHKYEQSKLKYESKRNKVSLEKKHKSWHEIVRSAGFLEQNTRAFKQVAPGSDVEYPEYIVATTSLISRLAQQLQRSFSAPPSKSEISDLHEKAKEVVKTCNMKMEGQTPIKAFINIVETIQFICNQLLLIKDLDKSVLEKPAVIFTVQCGHIKTRLEKIKADYLKMVASKSIWNDKKKCGDFFSFASKALQALNAIEGDAVIREVVGLSFAEEKDTAISGLYLNKILDNGVSLALVGDAGSGKSTTLEMYAQHRFKNQNTELVIFIPLSKLKANPDRLSKTIDPKRSESASVKKEEAMSEFYNNISELYREIKVSISPSDVQARFDHAKDIALICDGYDELNKKSLFSHAISHLLSDPTKNVQIVISSRFPISETYLSDLNQITLLPFTNSAIERFVRTWLNDSPAARKEVLRHLSEHKEVLDVVRNPLMATILCVLAGHGIKLPTNQVSIYEERFRLLFGHYDYAKGIKRNESPEQLMEIIARKLALILHEKHSRQLPKDILYNKLLERMNYLHKFEEKSIKVAFEELVNPCNVLIPEDLSNGYGFGHLSYQEFLVAKELTGNRGLDIMPLMQDHWWFGALRFFSMMTDDISSIIEDSLAIYGELSPIKLGLREMIKVRPQREAQELLSLIKKHIELDSRDYDPHEYEQY